MFLCVLACVYLRCYRTACARCGRDDLFLDQSIPVLGPAAAPADAPLPSQHAAVVHGHRLRELRDALRRLD